jgi:pimeloyl-[acyl-carrier protein] methyl ester esterase
MTTTTPPRLVLLPGMDGTGVMFADLLRALPPMPEPVVISYPVDVTLDLEGLVAFVEPKLPRDEPFILLGESFSGPVAVRLAALRPAGLVGLVLVATFLRYPPTAAGLLRIVTRDLVFRIPPPAPLLRLMLVGMDVPASLVSAVRSAIRRVAPGVMASRMRAVLAADVRAEAAGLQVPVLYLRGTHDRLVGGWAVKQIRAACPDADVRTFSAAHLVLQQHPEEAAAALVSFSRRCCSAAA